MKRINARMLNAFKRSHKFANSAHVTVIKDPSTWAQPPGVTMSLTRDEWVDANGHRVDPSTFWATGKVEIPVAYADQEREAIDIINAGINDGSSILFFTTSEYKDIVSNAYCFLIDGQQYRLHAANCIPMPQECVLVQFEVRKWD